MGPLMVSSMVLFGNILLQCNKAWTAIGFAIVAKRQLPARPSHGPWEVPRLAPAAAAVPAQSGLTQASVRPQALGLERWARLEHLGVPTLKAQCRT